MYHHPLLHKIFIYISTAMFFALAISGAGLTAFFFLLYLGEIESNLHSSLFLVIIILVSWVYCIRCAYLASVFLKTINFKITYNDSGVEIEGSNEKIYFKWHDLKNYKEYSDMDVLALLDSNKKTIIMLWQYAPGFNKFVQKWIEKCGI
ncbi:hypothetical protein AAEU28_14500 [Pseudoalteromonas sp. SS15]|uniref:hypothetical protein n=1 Tax=Pseudoalteromonas sp. SS15 TaxID=3139393 RepID=UPI003BACE30C